MTASADPNKPGGLLSQHRLLRAVIDTDWATRLDHKVASHVIERYFARFGNSRASLRYLEKATGAERPSVIASLRRLAEKGVITVLRQGKGTRPTEYTLHFDFPATTLHPASGMVGDTSISGIVGNTSCGIADNTSSAPSGMVGDTETFLQVPADRAGILEGRTDGSRGAAEPPPSPVLAPGEVGPPRVESESTSNFDEFWRAFPRKHKKADARAAYEALNPGLELHAKIVAQAKALAAHYAAAGTPKQFWPWPHNWLKREGYDEDLPAAYVDAKEAAIARAKDKPLKSKPKADNDNVPSRSKRPQVAEPGWLKPGEAPAGTYLVTPVASDVSTAANGAKRCRLVFHMCDGPQEGQRFEHVFDIESPDFEAQEAGQRVLMDLCRAAKLPGIDDTSELHDKIFTATVKSNGRVSYAAWGA